MRNESKVTSAGATALHPRKYYKKMNSDVLTLLISFN